MHSLNYRHLHYFWVVAKCGGVTRAGEKLHVTPQSISTQMGQLEDAVGAQLWKRSGRKLELTDTGNLVLEYAERLFSVGEELKEALRLKTRAPAAAPPFRIGISDAVVKVMACRVIEPVLGMEKPPRLICREGRFQDLLALLAVHELDIVIADRPMPTSLHVNGFNHLLLECGISFVAKPEVARQVAAGFPQSMCGAPVLLPGGDSAMRPQLLRWFDQSGVKPKVVAEFDDTALMKAFGSHGYGIFPMPELVTQETCAQFGVVRVGSTDEVVSQIHAITTDRRLAHPAMAAIHEAAKRSTAKRPAVRVAEVVEALEAEVEEA